MKKALVACRSGMGSSMMLKIKVDQVVKEHGYPIEVEHSNMDALVSFKGELVITMADIADEIKGSAFYVVGIQNLMDKNEINEKLAKFLEDTK